MWNCENARRNAGKRRREQQKLENVDNPDKYTVLYNYRSYNQLSAYYNSIPDKQNYGFLKVYIDAHQGTGSLTYSEIGGDAGQVLPPSIHVRRASTTRSDHTASRSRCRPSLRETPLKNRQARREVTSRSAPRSGSAFEHGSGRWSCTPPLLGQRRDREARKR